MSLVTVDCGQDKGGCQEKYESTLHSWADKMRLTKLKMLRFCIGEFLGTIVLIIFGLGVGAQFKFGDTEVFTSVTLGWGMAVMIGLFISGTMGCGLMNPALTLAFAFAGKVRWIYVIPFTLVQIFGAYIGALCVYGVYSENIRLFELDNGHPVLSMADTAGIFVTGPSNAGNIAGFTDQILSTAILAAICLAIGDKHNYNVPKYLSPLYVGLTVFALVGAFCVNAGACMNPARDLGPRLAILSVGYTDAFTYKDYYFWVPFVGPYIGAIIGTLLYELTVGIHLKGIAEKEEAECQGCEFDAA